LKVHRLDDLCAVVKSEFLLDVPDESFVEEIYGVILFDVLHNPVKHLKALRVVQQLFYEGLIITKIVCLV
jgi:hypothetical protein